MTLQDDTENEHPKIRIQVSSEYKTLREAVVGYYHNYYRKDVFELLQSEIENLKSILRMNGVKVHELDPVQGSKDQVTPRDVAFVIDNTLILGSMVEERRRNELKGLTRLLKIVEGKVIYPPEGVFLEGGDILVDGKDVFVGIGERTNLSGVNFLSRVLEDTYTVHPIEINALHLDVVLNILSRDRAICYSKRIKKVPNIIKRRFALIETTRPEYAAMCVNVLAIGNRKVLVRNGFSRLNATVRAEGFDVIEMPFSVVPLKCGGIRCTVLPLVRA